MKAASALVLICLFFNSLNAQITEGKMSVGVNLSGDYEKYKGRYFYSTSTTPSDVWEWKLVANPYFQYFVKDNLALGIGLNYSISQKIEDLIPLGTNGYTMKYRESEHWFTSDVFITKYWFVAPKLALYLQPKVGAIYALLTNYRKIEDPSNTAPDNEILTYGDVWMYNANLNAGIQYFISPKLALQAQMEVAQYLYMKDYQTGGFLKNQPYFMFGVNYVFH